MLILLGVIAGAAALAVLVHRRKRREELPEYPSALTFVGAAYGLLLGLLVAFAVGHYTDVRHESQAEATSLIALYDTVGVYPQETSDRVRHNLICYMRSIVHDDWPSMERENDEGAPRTLALGDRLRASVRNLPNDDPRQGSAYGRAGTLMADAGKSRQSLLFFTQAVIPTAMWAVIYVGAALVVLLMVSHYAPRPAGRVVALGSVVVLMIVVVGVLGALDQPFSSGARVQPDQMRQAVDLVLTGERNPAILRPCG